MDDQTPHAARQIAIPAALLLPFAGFVGAVVLLWQRGIGRLDLALLAVICWPASG